MAQIIWTRRSIRDLDSIGKYIAIDSEDTARKFVQSIMKKSESLINYPEKGPPLPEKIPGNYRQIIHKSYRIIYRVDKKGVIIITVYHQKKLLLKSDNQ